MTKSWNRRHSHAELFEKAVKICHEANFKLHNMEVNAFILFGYPLIRSYLGRPFEAPPAIPARMERTWEATGRFKSFDQIVYVQLRADDRGIMAVPGSAETEKASFLVSKDGYLLVPGGKGRLNGGEPVSVHLLPGFSGGFEWLTRA